MPRSYALRFAIESMNEAAGGLREAEERLSIAARTEATLDQIAAANPQLNALTRLLTDRAMATAKRLVPAHDRPGSLVGMPFVVKDLFDVVGLPTTAGAEVRAAALPAARDAVLIERLEAAGAILVGTTNMDAFAYGFATDNAWTGLTRNPHDLRRLAGGSSGGAAAAVAAGLVPLALGSDTNGSVRVPASLCGVYGLKPTHGHLPSGGMFPFVASFDDPGPFAASLTHLRTFWTLATGQRVELERRPLRAARLGGWFAEGLSPDIEAAITNLCEAIGNIAVVEWDEAEAAQSGAFLMTAAEGGALHHTALTRDARRYDPAIRDRLLAGALLPARDYIDARTLMDRMRGDLDAIFGAHDILITPATPSTAPRAEHPVVAVRGTDYLARSHLGLFTQPITFLGVPALSVPLWRPGLLPLGAQLVARPGRETDLFAFAERLEEAGLIGVSPPSPITDET